MLFICLLLGSMSETLGELLKRLGKRQADCGITQVAVSYINTGKRQARPSTIARIAQATGQDEATIRAACKASWQRAHASPATAIGPVADGQTSADVVHAGDTAQPGRA